MKSFQKLGAVGALTALPVAAMASPYAALEAAVDFDAVSTSLISVAAIVVGVLITIRAVQWIKSAVKK